MINVPTIYDRFADDLASFEVPNITITLSRGTGMSYEDFLSLRRSASVRHPNLNLTAILMD